ncbi:MAG: M20/M25/M40 family metallo-hydrolase [Planctomycetota bacterium]|nr:M20/M25/M40 family metallo-hydrolase [Planctomycetota bacterium]
MKRSLPCLLGLAVLAIPLPLAAQSSALEQIQRVGLEDNRVQDHLRVLTRRFGPRLTSSQVLYDAQVWAMQTFRSFGLEARLERWGEFPVGFHRGPSSARMTAPEERELECITRCWSAGTLGPVEGRALITPRSPEELEALLVDLPGAWVLSRRLGRDERRAWEEELAGDDEDADGRRLLEELEEAFDSACEEAGIAGRVSSGPADGLLVSGGNHRIDPEDLPSAVTVTLRGDQFKQVVEDIEAGAEVRLEFDIDNRFVPGPIDLYNVVAEIEGTEFPDEYVIVQAHIDAWDGAQGTCDNGTGISTTLEAARILASLGERPRRTIRFILYGGEEQGLLGSAAYVKEHSEDLERTSIVLNHDNGPNPLKGISATEAMIDDFEQVFAPVKKLDPERPFEVLEVDGIRGGASDHASFVKEGVPAFHWIQSQEGYRHVHHTQHDTFDYADADDQRFNATVVALSAWGFSQLDGLVDRTNMRAPQPRRMGVQLDGNRIARVTPGMRAAEAGWKVDDVILSIDGVETTSRGQVVRALQQGGASKLFVLQRGEARIDSTFDYSDDPDESRRKEMAADRESKREERALEREARRRRRTDGEDG